MKRYLICCALLAGVSSSLPGGQDSPADLAARQEAEERYKTMSAKIEDLQQELQAYKKNLAGVGDELKALREETVRAHNNNKDVAVQKSLEQLAEAIREVDKKRIADNEKILAVLAGFKETLKDKPSAAAPRPPAPAGVSPTVPPKSAGESPKSGAEKGYEYAIRERDTLSAITTKLVQQGIKVTQKQIMEANPSVNWNRLRVGQKIFIPAPSQ